MTTMIIREQLHKQIDSLPDDIVQQDWPSLTETTNCVSPNTDTRS